MPVSPGLKRLLSVAAAWLLSLTLGLLALPPAVAADLVANEAYRCDGEPLIAQLHAGAVDDPTIPNRSGGTLPGAFVVLQWQELALQLPRTNNAGPPSFSDGRWWWSLEDRDHPRFRLRQGNGRVQDFACERPT